MSELSSKDFAQGGYKPALPGPAGPRPLWRLVAWLARHGLGQGGSRRLLLLAALLGLGVAGSTGLMIAQQHQHELNTASRQIERLSLVLAHQAERTLQAVELVQRGILDQVQEVETPEQFHEALSGFAVHEDMRTRIRGLPQIDAITAIDAQGNLVNFSRYWPIPPVNIADRDYYRALRADPQRMTFISEPVPNRGTGTRTAYFARKVVNRGGEFLGLILIGLDLNYFESLYEDAGFGANSTVALFREDGMLLARYPRLQRPDQQPHGPGARLERLRHASAGNAQFRGTSSVDGEERLFALHRLQGYPVGISVSIGVQQALADWRRLAAYLLGAGLLLEGVIIGLGLLVARHLRAQHLLAAAQLARAQAEAELANGREREAAQAEARVRDANYSLALNTMSQGLCMFDPNQRLALVSPRFAELFNLPPGAVIPGMPYAEVLRWMTKGGELLADETPEGVQRLLLAGRPVSYIREMTDGRSLSVGLVPKSNGGWVTTYEDVTERRHAEAQIAHMARHDALTGLPNRLLFRERLEEALLRSRRGEGFALLCLDLDRFKAVNDTLGHPIGDALLRLATERMLQNCRDTDLVARLGGDEFAIIQPGLEQPYQATALARRIIDSLNKPFAINGQSIRIGSSIGIALIPQDGADAVALLKNADLALYRAKAERGSFRLFEPEMDARMQARRALEFDLRHALENDQFELFYQPILDLHSRALRGFEALLRWNHPAKGLVPPDRFIPLAEEIGLISEIGAWVLRRACAEATTWPAGLKVSVNLSTVQFRGPGPMAAVAAALAASGLDPARLELEITETVMLEDTAVVLEMLAALKAMGTSIAMDDFGTGYSSLNYLRRFPFDRVKIDKSFIADLHRSPESMAIVEAVTTLCKTLGMATTVEGVETEAQMAELQHSDGTNVQGYLFGRPGPATGVPAVCRALGLAYPGDQAASRICFAAD